MAMCVSLFRHSQKGFPGAPQIDAEDCASAVAGTPHRAVQQVASLRAADVPSSGGERGDGGGGRGDSGAEPAPGEEATLYPPLHTHVCLGIGSLINLNMLERRQRAFWGQRACDCGASPRETLAE
jgi:hypothetical protein